ncbi:MULTISPECIES: (d)CMP kinase [Anaerococcus]|uniref:Cytidylate kinase n=2 Tax=Anaerococcus vaginalis TaxID=33037 RepID=C7HUB5_9FIRM|nr:MULTISPECIES: (d)CMP kinase [Anaerococcus]EEU12683.1 cytidylate kinase [Anaerococcus vaginalis ATCC 51170]MDU2375865.1 (d)CMP kinase [Anaerococcus vaginalis]MDU2648607.1 (d)CMP kinase [Anaerococcus vaginalis]OFJ69589.1 cytidylate kinase [Anaerococcus sp. HMSC065G05]QQB61238.1 (d)CMP kinase [Anaerococcus vaginalis]
MSNFIIALDGPSGSGKSTIANILAKKLKISYLNTGSMYRAVTLFFLENNIKKSDKIDIDLLRKINIDIKGDKVFLNEKDVSEKIRNKEVTENVSWVSSIFLVRKYLVDMQRKISQNKSIILDGRDIGTVVFPNAKYKFFLVASSEVRAKRRYEQNEIDKSLEEIQKDIEKRDYLDSHREISPLKKAEDAIEIDSSNLTIDETIEEIINKMDKEDVL